MWRKSFKICAYNDADASIGKKLKMMLPENIVERTKACLISKEELEVEIDKMLGGLKDSYLDSYEVEEDSTEKLHEKLIAGSSSDDEMSDSSSSLR